MMGFINLSNYKLLFHYVIDVMTSETYFLINLLFIVL